MRIRQENSYHLKSRVKKNDEPCEIPFHGNHVVNNATRTITYVQIENTKCYLEIEKSDLYQVAKNFEFSAFLQLKK